MNNDQSIRLTFNALIQKLSAENKAFSTLMERVALYPARSFFISGGVVRDALLGISQRVKDIDLFLAAEAFEDLRAFLEEKGALQANQFGTHRWFPLVDLDMYYDIIPISAFYNGLWPCRDMTDVLNQFDITANAVAFDLRNGDFYDPQNGYNDIQHGVLRAVRFDFPELAVSANISISRNSVLWFRYQYYAHKLGFTIEPITQNWLVENKFRISDLESFKTYFFDPMLIDELD